VDEPERRGEGIGALNPRSTKYRCQAVQPARLVLDLLEWLPPKPLGKQDGEMIIDAIGHRLL